MAHTVLDSTGQLTRDEIAARSDMMHTISLAYISGVGNDAVAERMEEWDRLVDGLKIADGLGMLLHQAAPGFEKWFGVQPKVTSQLRNMIIVDMEAAK